MIDRKRREVAKPELGLTKSGAVRVRKPGAGKKAKFGKPLKPVTVSLREEDIEFLRSFGNGSLGSAVMKLIAMVKG